MRCAGSRMCWCRCRPMTPATRCWTEHARRYRGAPGLCAGSAISRPPGSMATAAAAGSTRPRRSGRPASAAGAGSSPRRVGSICGASRGLPVHIFRLAGIYGPGRSAFDALRARPPAHRQARPSLLAHSCRRSRRGAARFDGSARPGVVYNVCDDDPAPPEAVDRLRGHAARRRAAAVGAVRQRGLSAMARSFYDDNKRVRNALIKRSSASRCAIRLPRRARRDPRRRDGLRLAEPAGLRHGRGLSAVSP